MAQVIGPQLHPLVVTDESQVDFACWLYMEALEWAVRSALAQSVNPRDALMNPGSAWFLLRNEKRLVGLAGLERINLIDGVCEPFVAVHPEYRRVGMGLRMGEALRQAAVGQLDIRRIQSAILAGAPSERILIKMGFQLEGTMVKARFKNGEYRDVRMYAWMR